MTSVEVNGERVAIANVGGQYYAFSDACTHRGCSLGSSELTDNVVTCVCHGGQFDVTTGEVVSGPPFDPVQTYPVAVEGDNLSIS
jgi:nitrite reductase/ring-hydroxylating ferredoxin subunit